MVSSPLHSRILLPAIRVAVNLRCVKYAAMAAPGIEFVCLSLGKYIMTADRRICSAGDDTVPRKYRVGEW